MNTPVQPVERDFGSTAMSELTTASAGGTTHEEGSPDDGSPETSPRGKLKKSNSHDYLAYLDPDVHRIHHLQTVLREVIRRCLLVQQVVRQVEILVPRDRRTDKNDVLSFEPVQVREQPGALIAK